ncbi:hypothetical protein HEN71_019625 [Escherichia coli]|jgi:hypothetical protein|nr:hypothetical protein EC54115_05102 [Escherichia coli 541-15]KUG86776.1 hypothetical protein ARC95_12160 [Escherichia coli]MBB7030505.1 hypothetical protein [Escherichia coli]BEA49300.1 hypothetical protein VEE12_17400 [Escherichia coli]BEC26968.1 hypothetical protein VEE51_12150 [Escherichia coli]
MIDKIILDITLRFMHLRKKTPRAFNAYLTEAHFFKIKLFCPKEDRDDIIPVTDNRKKTPPASLILSVLDIITLVDSASIAPNILNTNTVLIVNINFSLFTQRPLCNK